MKKTTLRLILAAALGLSAAAHAAPTQLTASAGEIRDIKYASGTGATAVLYAASQGGGVFKSTDAGQTWARTGLNTGYVWSIAPSVVSPTTTVYAATDAGLFKSTNSGTSWTQLTYDAVRAVAVMPGSVTNDTLLIGVQGQGIQKSTDSGANFTRVSTGLDSTEVTKIVFQNGTTAYAILDCNYQSVQASPQGYGAWGGIFKSNATFTSWTNFNNGGSGGTVIGTGTGTSAECAKSIATNSTTVFVGTYLPFSSGGKLYRSTGAGWTATSTFLGGVEAVAVDRISPTTNIHVGTIQFGPWGSTDGGANFTSKSSPDSNPATGDPDVWTRVQAVETVPGLANTVLVGAKGIGIMRTTVYNTSPVGAVGYWNPTGGPFADRARDIANDGSKYFMALENGGVMTAPNPGTGSWSELDAGFGTLGGPGDPYNAPMNTIAVDPTSPSVVVVAGLSLGMRQLQSGTTWTTAGVPSALVNSASVQQQPESITFSSSGRMFYTMFNAPGGASGGGLWVSPGGVGLLAATPYPDNLLSCGSAGAYAGANKVIPTSGAAYLLRYDALPQRSASSFAALDANCITAPNAGFERLYFRDLTQKPTNTAILVGASNKGIFRSSDNGVNWSRVAISGTPSQIFSGVAYVANGNLFGITRAGGLYCSTDDGTTWQTVSLGSLPAVSFRSIRVLNGNIHIVTDGGGVYTGFAQTCP